MFAHSLHHTDVQVSPALSCESLSPKIIIKQVKKEERERKGREGRRKRKEEWERETQTERGDMKRKRRKRRNGEEVERGKWRAGAQMWGGRSRAQ